jgi:hypothetical protein
MEENREQWTEICAQAAKEQDPEKLMELISQINRLLEAKERRLKANLLRRSRPNKFLKEGL